MLTDIYKFVKKISFVFKPNFTIYYGNYGGSGYTAKHIYDSKTETVYSVDKDAVVQSKNVTIDRYVEMTIDNMRSCEPVDYIDSCFKLHDIDSKNLTFRKIINITNTLFKNLSKQTLLFYVLYPLFLPLTILYFYTFGKQQFVYPDNIIEQLDTLRNDEIKRCQEIYKITLV